MQYLIKDSLSLTKYPNYKSLLVHIVYVLRKDIKLCHSSVQKLKISTVSFTVISVVTISIYRGSPGRSKCVGVMF
jgi:hypothetical protein